MTHHQWVVVLQVLSLLVVLVAGVLCALDWSDPGFRQWRKDRREGRPSRWKRRP